MLRVLLMVQIVAVLCLMLVHAVAVLQSLVMCYHIICVAPMLACMLLMLCLFLLLRQ